MTFKTNGPACPQCEYAKRGFGKPNDLGGGLWRCAECGGHWREIIAQPRDAASDAMGHAKPAQEPELNFSEKLAMLRKKARPASNEEPRNGSDKAKAQKGRAGRKRVHAGLGGMVFHKSSSVAQSAGIALKAGGAVAALVAGFLGMAAISPMQAPEWTAGLRNPLQAITGQRKPVLEVSSIQASRPEGGGLDTIRVEGQVTNRSQKPQPLGTFNITVTDAEGKEIVRWLYRPALSHLEPGQTIRFASTKGGVPMPAQDVKIRFAKATWTVKL